MKNRRCGFGYYISLEKIKEYQAIPVEKRLAWLYQGNLLRMRYPIDIVELQDRFRHGEI